MPEAIIIGPALTVRFEVERFNRTQASLNKVRANLGSGAAAAICQPGDVLVVDGKGQPFSVLGELSALNIKKAGLVGAIVDGAVRDIQGVLDGKLPVWTRHTTPQTGGLRIEAVELNGIVTVGGVRVEPGDIIVADRSGIAVVPASHADDILVEARAIVARDMERKRAMGL